METNNLFQVAEVALSYRSKVRAKDRPTVSSSSDAYRLFWKMWSKDSIEHVEEFKMILMNRANRVIGIMNVSKGGITGTIADPRVILQAAILSNACAVALAHNHPSGNLRASQADETITRKTKDALALVDIKLLDHIILGTDEGDYFSMCDEGLI